jgi:MoxR-like ATPase
MAVTKMCRSCGQTLPSTSFTKNSANPDGLAGRCRTCISNARVARSMYATQDPRVGAVPVFEIPTPEPEPEVIPEIRYRYIPPAGLLELFESNQAMVAAGQYPEDMFFVGQSGTGKTEGAQFLAEAAGLDFVKVDAAAMTDAESWFGTREVVAKEGVSVTEYRPSNFVLGIQRRCLLLIDEANRIKAEHLNILLPLKDGTRQVTNPLTGDVIKRHPECYIILSGNRGLRYVGTYAIEPALLTRVLTIPFAYLPPDVEAQLVQERWGVVQAVAATLVRFANEVRSRSEQDEEISPVSTREILRAAKLIKYGTDADLAVQSTIIWAASDEGGSESVQTRLRQIWIGLRPLLEQ